MTDEMRTELRRKALRAGIEGIINQDAIGCPWGVNLMAPHGIEPEEVLGTPSPPPLTTAQQLALSVLLGEAPEMALAEYLLDQGHEYAVAVAERARVDGEKAGIESEKARCLHLLGLGRPYFARGGVVSDTAANELRLAIDGNLKPTPKAFFESSLLR